MRADPVSRTTPRPEPGTRLPEPMPARPISGAEFESAARGSPEGRFLAGRGRALARQAAEFSDRVVGLQARTEQARLAVQHAERYGAGLLRRHRGGDRPWFLRWLIAAGALAEGMTAYVGMEILVSSQMLAVMLAMLAALVGSGLACALANRRLNGLALPGAARILEALFVLTLTVLRLESLRVQGEDLPTAIGAAALAALISALALLGIEEVVLETRTFAMSAAAVRTAWRRWRHASAVARLGRVRGKTKAASEALQQRYLDFLLEAEGLSSAEASQHAAALHRGLRNQDGGAR